MASNYKNEKIEKVITKKDLTTMTWRSLLLQASFNYERMQGGGWLYTILPGLKKIHKNDEDLSNSMSDHLQFFNTHPFLVTFIAGIIISMEENKQPRDTINGIKVALMGPLGGIGDALFWLTLLPITAGIGASLSLSGNPLGPILFLIVFNIVHLFLRFWLMNYGYNTGTKAISSLKENTKKISRAATIVGLCVVGGLIASYVNFTLPINIHAGKIVFNLQKDVLDKVMPAILPLGYTAFCFWMLKKKEASPLFLILITVVVGLALAFFGVFPAK